MNWPLTGEPLRVGVIGGGVVGRATARGWLEHARVRVYDTLPERRTHSFAETVDCDVLFLCLPTPAGADGRCDTSAFDEFCRQIVTAERKPRLIAVRSTVDVGFTARFAKLLSSRHVVHNPEFLTARTAEVDYQTPSRVIIGYAIARASSAVAAFARCCRDRWPGVPVLEMWSESSELVKLGTNAFFASKINFFNLIRAACEKAGCDWDTVRAGILSDGRIAHSHTTVPGPVDSKFGYGGNCLPKDIANFRHSLPEELQGVVREIERTNQILRESDNEDHALHAPGTLRPGVHDAGAGRR